MVTVDPDLVVLYVWKISFAYTEGSCITEIAEIKVIGASEMTICIKAEDPEKDLKQKI